MSHGFINEEIAAWRYEPDEKKAAKMGKKLDRGRKKYLKIYGYPGGDFNADMDVQWAATRRWRRIWPLNYVPVWWF